MSSPVRMFIGVSAHGVGGIMVLHWQGMVPSGSGAGRWKCFQMGHVTDVEVWLTATLWLPCAMQRKHDRGQSHPRPLCLSLRGQLK